MKLLGLTALFAHFMCLLLAHANVEKEIFVIDPSTPYLSNTPRIRKLQLDTLNHSSAILRKSLPVAFPSDEHPHGLESWYLLESLNDDQRYEVRICWAAIQPTKFWLKVFTSSEVLQDPELLRSVDHFIQHRQNTIEAPNYRPGSGAGLLLRVEAAADFFTTNKSRMRNPPPVDVDIILDPYILNFFPSSLKQTAIYIVALAIGSWFLSKIVWSRLSSPALTEKEHDE